MIIDNQALADTLYDTLAANGVTGRIIGVRFISDQYVHVLTTHGMYIFDTMQFPTTIWTKRTFSLPRRWLLTVWFWLQEQVSMPAAR